MFFGDIVTFLAKNVKKRQKVRSISLIFCNHFVKFLRYITNFSKKESIMAQILFSLSENGVFLYERTITPSRIRFS